MIVLYKIENMMHTKLNI